VNAVSSTLPQQSNGSRQRIPSTAFQKPRQYQTVTHHDKLMNYHKSPPFLIMSVKLHFHTFFTPEVTFPIFCMALSKIILFICYSQNLFFGISRPHFTLFHSLIHRIPNKVFFRVQSLPSPQTKITAFSNGTSPFLVFRALYN